MRVLVLACMLLLGGCAPMRTTPIADLENYSAASSAHPGQALVHVIYGNSPDGRLFAFHVTADGKKVVGLKPDQFVKFTLEPGEHRIAIQCPPLLNCPSGQISGQFRAGRAYFLFAQYGSDAPTVDLTGVTLNSHLYFGPIAPEQGTDFMSRYKERELGD